MGMFVYCISDLSVLKYKYFAYCKNCVEVELCYFYRIPTYVVIRSYFLCIRASDEKFYSVCGFVQFLLFFYRHDSMLASWKPQREKLRAGQHMSVSHRLRVGSRMPVMRFARYVLHSSLHIKLVRLRLVWNRIQTSSGRYWCAKRSSSCEKSA